MEKAGVLALAGMRIGIGALAWVRPHLAARLFRLPAPRAETSYLWRLFGVRDIAIGIGTVASQGAQRRRWARFGLACDLADGAAAALGARQGDLPRDGAVALVAVPAAAVGFGVWALRPKG
ncbi:MAG: DUF4267 domain-containing protein [Mycobacterium sp.]